MLKNNRLRDGDEVADSGKYDDYIENRKPINFTGWMLPKDVAKNAYGNKYALDETVWTYV